MIDLQSNSIIFIKTNMTHLYIIQKINLVIQAY